MTTRRCRACDSAPARSVHIRVSVRHQVMEWRCVLCRDCWRAWEAMLDSASEATQPGLSVTVNGLAHPGWLW
jgi:hypothetical protein